MDTNNKYFLPASVVLAGALIAGAVVYNGSRPATTGGTQPSYNIADVKIEGEPFIGNANAPVTVAFWSDFQCPFCKQFEVGGHDVLTERGITTAFIDVKRDYVDTGKVKIVFKDVAFLGDDSLTAGIYGQSVWRLYPSQYLAWRTAMMQAQDEEHGGFGDAASIDALNAKVPGLDAAAIKADVAANGASYKAHVEAVTAEAQSLGVSGTPNFIVGKELLNGAVPFAAFKGAIDPLL